MDTIVITEMPKLRFFKPNELSCPFTNEVQLADGFGERMDELRACYGHPIIVNSCCRSKEYNTHLGGHERSLHVYDNPAHPTGGSCAMDLAMHDGIMRAKLVRLALEKGFSVGVAQEFLHVDDRTRVIGLPQVLYVY